jgi:putative two-component system response regulator
MLKASDFFSRAHILIVEDDAAVQRLLERTLKSNGFLNVTAARDVGSAQEIWNRSPPDLALVDLHLPGASGFQLLEHIRDVDSDSEFLPVIMLTGDADPAVRRRALDLGAHDFLTKPFDTTEVLLRIRNLLRTRLMNRRLLESNNELEARVLERTLNLEEARREALDHLARAAEFRDDVTGQHTHRVGRVSAGIARVLGWDEDAIGLIRNAAPLHDIGKIGIPDSILLKSGPLTREEFDVMKAHTTMGAAILAGSHAPVFLLAREIALTHHERWDGTGYPAGTQGDTIPIAGRIVCAADVYDALTHERPYKDAMTAEAALAMIDATTGTHFDPLVVAALHRHLDPEIPLLPEP